MIKKHKKFRRPKHSFDSSRIKSEDLIVAKYGLKNKKEIWKAKAKLDQIRSRAKKLANLNDEEKEKFIKKTSKMGYNVKTIIDILALTEEDILNRRLQTIVFKCGIATTPNGARQLVTHKKILVNKKIVNVPSYQISIDEENKIEKKLNNKIHKKELNKEVI